MQRRRAGRRVPQGPVKHADLAGLLATVLNNEPDSRFVSLSSVRKIFKSPPAIFVPRKPDAPVPNGATEKAIEESSDSDSSFSD